MKTNPAAKLLAITLLAAMGSQGSIAAAAPPTPSTIWSFLGIPQGLHRVRDATANRFGKHPGLERTDAIKRIADPANLESDNPAIKAAAQAKADADLAPQKIKAIRYLAEIGCGCSSQSADVQQALLAALDDCTEEVRYEAALALCKTAGNKCKSCDATCCGADSMAKLRDVAFGQDDDACWHESSRRVRAMAQSALNACEMNYVPEEATTPEIREQRVEPEVRTRDIQQPTPAEPGTEEPGTIGPAVVPEPAPAAAEPPADAEPPAVPAPAVEQGQSSTFPTPRRPTPSLVHPAGYLWISDHDGPAAGNGGKLRYPPMPKVSEQGRFRGATVRTR